MKTKKVKGFTLIELIVVIAIIGVLAAILVPTLMTWTRKSKVGSANTTAKTIYTTAQAAAQDCETRGSDVDAGPVSRAAGATDPGAAGTTTQWIQYEIENGVQGLNANSAYAVDLTVNYVINAAVFSANGTTLTGGYPNPVNTKIAVPYATPATLLTHAADKGGAVSGWNTEAAAPVVNP